MTGLAFFHILLNNAPNTQMTNRSRRSLHPKQLGKYGICEFEWIWNGLLQLRVYWDCIDCSRDGVVVFDVYKYISSVMNDCGVEDLLWLWGRWYNQVNHSCTPWSSIWCMMYGKKRSWCGVIQEQVRRQTIVVESRESKKYQRRGSNPRSWAC